MWAEMLIAKGAKNAKRWNATRSKGLNLGGEMQQIGGLFWVFVYLEINLL